VSDDDAVESFTDGLTGAYARGLLTPRLAEELARSGRSHTGCALLILDVDYLRSVNDAYGTERGDRILRQLTERINGLSRGYDVLYRYGGDEFALLLPETGKADAARVAHRLTEAVKLAEFPGEPPLSVSVSLGGAVFPEDAEDPAGLIEVALRRVDAARHHRRGGAVTDDAAQSDTVARPASARLLERDVPMTAARDFLTRLAAGQRGTLAVTGERGAGHSRFLAEVARAGRLRGFDVIESPESAGYPVPSGNRPVLVVIDATPDERLTALARAVPGALGAVHRGSQSVADLPVLDSVELLPWSPAAIRIWLRTTLQAEPSRVLVEWLAGRAGGLPARVEREVDRLMAGGGLVREPAGGWTVAPAFLARSAPARRPLPVPLTELVGRQQETAQVTRLVGGHRLVTLVGPAGVGKTRLALAVASAAADSFADGVVFVPLAAARTDDDIHATLAYAVEEPTDHALLLVLDNVEQAPGAARVISELLAQAPGVSVLCTTPDRLGIDNEQVYRVPPLSLPDRGTLPPGPAGVSVALAGSPALGLFAARARAAASDFMITGANLGTVMELCRRIDGLPLAIELTAAHVDVLSPTELLNKVSERLAGPEGGRGRRGATGRQLTLRRVIEWAADRLEPEERELLVRLGVFRGGATRAAISAVCPAVEDLPKRLGVLVERNLVRAEPDPADEVRYVLLEPLKAFALEKLPVDARARHAAHFTALADEAGRELTGAAQADWTARLDREYANFGAAFEYLLDTGDPERAAAVALGLWRFWRAGTHLGDGRRKLERLLSVRHLPDAQRAQVLHAAAVLAGAQDDHETAERYARHSRELAMSGGDARTVAHASDALGAAALGTGDLTGAHGHFADSLDRWTGLAEPFGMATAHGNLTKLALRTADVDTASGHADRSLELDRAAGNTRGVMLGLLCLGEIRLLRGDAGAATEALTEALDLARALREVPGEAMAHHQLGLVALGSGRSAEALSHVAIGARMRRDANDRDDLAVSLDTLAALLATGHPATAGRLLGAAEALRARHNLPAPDEVAGTTRDDLLDRLAVGLGADGLSLALATGRSTDLHAVVEEALELSKRP
jgi:diguanylate cyclase (GGDEF)-like protein